MIDQFATLGNTDSIHRVSQHLDGLTTVRGLRVTISILCYKIVSGRSILLQYSTLQAEVLRQIRQYRRIEHVEVTRHHVHDARPLAIAQGIVLTCQLLNFAVASHALRSSCQHIVLAPLHSFVGLTLILRTRLLCIKHLACHSSSGFYGILDMSIIGITQFWAHLLSEAVYPLAYLRILDEIAVHLIAELAL